MKNIITDSPVNFSTFDDVYITCVNKCGSIFYLHKNYCYCGNQLGGFSSAHLRCNASACDVKYFGFCGTEEHNSTNRYCFCRYTVFPVHVREPGHILLPNLRQYLTILGTNGLDNQGECIAAKWEMRGDINFPSLSYYTEDCDSYNKHSQTNGAMCWDLKEHHPIVMRVTWNEAFSVCPPDYQLSGVDELLYEWWELDGVPNGSY